MLAKYFQDKFFDDIKRIIGGSPGKQSYKDFIINNAKALYDVFSQQVFNKSFQDFIIQTEEIHGIKGLINLFGIESPGLTSSLAIGETIRSIL